MDDLGVVFDQKPAWVTVTGSDGYGYRSEERYPQITCAIHYLKVTISLNIIIVLIRDQL